MARFKPQSPRDLEVLRAGLCPECGATARAGAVACIVCRTEFGEHASLLAVAARPSAPPGPVDIHDLERGTRARSALPLTSAAVPEAFVLPSLGVSLTGAEGVLANAAMVDDVLVLAGKPPLSTELTRARINHAASAAAVVDHAPPVRPPPDMDRTHPAYRSATVAAPAVEKAQVSARRGARALD